MVKRFRGGAVGESEYRSRTWAGAAFFTSRQQHGDLTIAVKRFPQRDGVDPAAETLTFVMVPGIGVSSRYFQPLAAELARRGRVFLVDLPGYGAAPNPRRDVPLTGHADVLAGFLRESGIENPVLVGHSMGSEVVAILAERDRDVSDRIVLMAPTLEPRNRTRAAAIRKLLRDSLREPPRVVAISVTDYLLRCWPPYLFIQLRHMLADRLEDRMSAITARALVVTGDRDPIARVTWAAALAGLAPDAELRVVQGPHVIMHTDPTTVARHVVEFADAVRA
ncbi:MAG: alpha/beta fold hydrolase [Microbacterium sp.]|uniref:alpha/beta fold hydrolase n=1 Tax=Microbacterium sp. TaxID=51671 RepID=UPI001DDE899A|nr:alpha/beta fold hydrolase [Microbacterium sp.]MBW8764609.1 alpha/beta fold hydrolase [Microbacterium sp.]